MNRLVITVINSCLVNQWIICLWAEWDFCFCPVFETVNLLVITEIPSIIQQISVWLSEMSGHGKDSILSHSVIQCLNQWIVWSWSRFFLSYSESVNLWVMTEIPSVIHQISKLVLESVNWFVMSEILSCLVNQCLTQCLNHLIFCSWPRFFFFLFFSESLFESMNRLVMAEIVSLLFSESMLESVNLYLSHFLTS